MEKIVYNLSRREAGRFNGEFDHTNAVWISIGEPTDEFVHTKNEHLDKLPNLKMCFWDITRARNYTNFITGEEEQADPPKVDQAMQIVDFLLKHSDKDVIVNCAMGISRSGAIAQFCQDFLFHQWPKRFQDRACPNTLLYNMMRDYYKGENLIKYV